MGQIINETSLDLVRTAFTTAAQDVYDNGAPGVWRQFTTVESQTGLSAQLTVYDGNPKTREWTGSKEFKQLKKYTRQDALRKWEMSLRFDVDEINQDPTGLVARTIDGFRSSVASFYDEIMVDELFGNPTGYDGSTLMANDHERLEGLADQDNLTTAVLSLAELENAKQYFREVTNVRNRKLNMGLTALLVGPDNETVAQQITDSTQLVGISDTGEYIQPGTAGVDANASQFKNYIGGTAIVIVTPEIEDSSWAAMDLSKPRSRPMYMADFDAPTLTIKDRDEDDNVFHNDEVLMSVVGKMTPMAMNYQTIYGAIAP